MQQSRRSALKTLGVFGVAALGQGSTFGNDEPATESNGLSGMVGNSELSGDDSFLRQLRQLVYQTPLVDSHEHICDEDIRLQWKPKWTDLFSHYFQDDFRSAGMDRDTAGKVFNRDDNSFDTVELWRKIQPWWFAVKNTGYGQAARAAIRRLYHIDSLNEQTVVDLQNAFESSIQKGLYNRVLKEQANIESCQVDSGGGTPYIETQQPELLLQDINIVGFQTCNDIQGTTNRIGTTVNSLLDWHDTIAQFFRKYAPYAVAIKSQLAYSRGLDYEKVSIADAEPVFRKKLHREKLTPHEEKLLQDHLFWFCVDQANTHELPVKLHTGYYVGTNSMPLERLQKNPAQMSALCLASPHTRWVFMHTCYPYSRELIAIAKQFPNAYVQTCWAWVIDPIGTKNFLKEYLVTAPANKIHIFGGDYSLVENTLGHSIIARDGLIRALAELVAEQYLTPDDALELVEPLQRSNAHRIFALEKKYAAAKKVPWK